ncbi:MAG TPA: transglycosylase domain-containing protein [Candidatus Saccharimonadales bacterium]|nr:transglycosylase domain-containing protein [Candidatus Saccharimonadales bacterium]
MKKTPKSSGSRPLTTRSGKVLKVNRSLGERYVAMKQAKALRKVNRLRGLPKSRVKRIFWRLHPKRLAAYWFSRDGGIMALKIVGIGIVALFIITLAIFAYYRKDLKDITDVSGSNLGGSISYYDRTGKILLWQDYNAVKRVPVPSNQISNYLKQATVAIEDKNFYNERGFDIKGIARAAYVDVLHKGSTQGGSTITQQLVKLTQDFNQNRTLSLKVKELILAVELERTYTKDQILTSYLNVVPYGGVDYGAQAAASDYFHEDASDLTLAQSAFLAAIPKSPSVYSPYNTTYFDKEALLARYDYILDQMANQHMISQAQDAAAKKVDILAQVKPQQTKYAGIKAPYFVLAARDELDKRFSSQSAKVGGWKVITTLNMNLQKEAEKAVKNNLANVETYQADTEATDIEDVKTGQMLGLVGGTDFNNQNHGQLNFAHSVNISPGSSFKPYDYVTLIDNNNNVGAGSVLYDSKGPVPGYPCTTGTGTNGNCLHDFDYRYPGAETLRYALGGSRNVPAVKAMVEAVPGDTSANRTTSINKVISTADALMGDSDGYRCYKSGVDISTAKPSDETQCYSSSAIGDGAYLHLDDHTNGVASLARMGNSIPLTYILSIQNASGKTFYQYKQPKGTQVVRPDAAYIVDDMAADPNATYLWGSYKWQRYNGWETSIKTGTTNNNFDGLMMAWNTQFAVGSWVGYHTRNKALTTDMEYLTTPLTKTLMEYALDSLHTKPVNYKEPAGIQHLPAYVIRNKVGTAGEGDVEPSPSTDIYPSWYKQKAISSKSVTLDKISGKIATSCTPSAAKETLGGNAAPNAFSIDQFYPPGNNASTANNINSSETDDVHHCSDQRPSISLTANDNGDGSYTIQAFVSAGTFPFHSSKYTQYPGKVTFSFNGKVIKTVSPTDPSDNISFNYTPAASGTLTATVTDSVLYSDSATASISHSSAGPTGFSATSSGPFSVQFSWSGGSAPYTVYDSNNNPVCSTPSTSCSGPSSGNGTYYVQDNDGNKSNTDST